ncbi:hypothetical protein TNCV_3975341 [Trichonephila clavipes]|nr:hypothetical protein TNCV_3975341 [Trichonephila clavipes]
MVPQKILASRKTLIFSTTKTKFESSSEEKGNHNTHSPFVLSRNRSTTYDVMCDVIESDQLTRDQTIGERSSPTLIRVSFAPQFCACSPRERFLTLCNVFALTVRPHKFKEVT